MSDLDREVVSAEAARAREAVRELDRPAAATAFRARLRQEFTSGTIESAAPARLFVVPWHRRSMTRWGAAALAAAAAVVVVSVLNQPPAWRLGAVTGEGLVVVDGVPVPTQHAGDLQRRLKPGVFVQMPPGVELEIASRGQIAVQFAAGTQASVPRAPGRWFQRNATVEIRAGELRVVTGRGFQGARLTAETPEARVEVTGTTFAVICEPAGTCVCVFEGRLRVGTRGGVGMADVSGGSRRFVFADGRPEESAAMRDTEHGPLGDFRERMGAEMGAK